MPNTTVDLRVFRGFMTEKECDELIHTARPMLARALAFNGSDFGPTDFRIRFVLQYCVVDEHTFTRHSQRECMAAG